ncbi:hypothetical protein [Clostridium perfringens]|uniref:Uncharacterized protein n=1 Tax=Clostridium perfringens TaxID=1502 RepID=A0AAN5NAU4_CLOPF|nr:hypothetical protein [Clostridium perfringens]MDK0593108.1 hypothetical protein [Clostridium perfringens]HAT4267772.1 hypothetical protein [Clostridium perfringens]HAT4299024.1 hypothetical protein [Clostridium perfringens]HAT4349934.1 hypothetical protein [Clostridium perfringens]HBI7033242.1 hypothetical protein [Clostridium perfringens]
MRKKDENLLLINYDIVQNNYCWMFSKFNKIEELINKLSSMDTFDKSVLDEAQESIIELIKFKKEFLVSKLEGSLKSEVIKKRQILISDFNYEEGIREIMK